MVASKRRTYGTDDDEQRWLEVPSARAFQPALQPVSHVLGKEQGSCLLTNSHSMLGFELDGLTVCCFHFYFILLPAYFT